MKVEVSQLGSFSGHLIWLTTPSDVRCSLTCYHHHSLPLVVCLGRNLDHPSYERTLRWRNSGVSRAIPEHSKILSQTLRLPRPARQSATVTRVTRVTRARAEMGCFPHRRAAKVPQKVPCLLPLPPGESEACPGFLNNYLTSRET